MEKSGRIHSYPAFACAASASKSMSSGGRVGSGDVFNRVYDEDIGGCLQTSGDSLGCGPETELKGGPHLI